VAYQLRDFSVSILDRARHNRSSFSARYNADVCVSFVRRDSNTAMRVADFLLPWQLAALICGG
jgi:hypothetical protein